MPNKAVEFTKKDHIAKLTLKRSRLDLETAQGLADACERINGDDDIYVAVITGSGKSFCAGGESYRSAASVAAVEKPVIAAINGDALGVGLELALSCDIRIASTQARFALPQVRDGFIPTDGATQRLPRIIGRGKALELLMTADTITAAQALEIGLVSHVFPANALEMETQKLAETIATKGPLALRYLKEAIIKGMDMTLEQGLRLEADLYFLLHTTYDRTEGVKSYLEKRPPKYKGK